ncbi:NUDIX hydrolase [Rhodococcus sovatensis]|uniref:NUDIX domain-containing protein n=1 Tax=Rhodococcus sovatensis TaxID=1805840 RepID=A0ABZ2PQ51_9NOCA
MSARSLHDSAVSTLEEWPVLDHHEDSLRHTMLAFLAGSPDGCLRSNEAGHITASSLVLDESGGQVLLTLHPRVGRWIQLGGHCEPEDETVQGAAMREAREESGIDELTIEPTLLSADTHPITCSLGKPTRHLDLRFLVRAAAGTTAVRSEESTDLRWWPVDGLPPNAEADTISHLVELARQR